MSSAILNESYTSTDEQASEWDAVLVLKRDDRGREAFDHSLIHNAVAKAFSDTNETISERDLYLLVERVATKARTIAYENDNVITVEQIQDLVIGSLYNAGYKNTGEAYVLFRKWREDRRTNNTLSAVEQEEVRMSLESLGNDDLAVFQHLNKYSRFDETKGRREMWVETVERNINHMTWYLDHYYDIELAPYEIDELYEFMLQRHSMPSMRHVQMSGPAARRSDITVYNCAYSASRKLKAFADKLFVLMQGTGAGFSVESEFIEDLPKVKRQKADAEPSHFVIPDTTEGWCEALRLGLEAWFEGLDMTYDFSQIRPAGTILKTKGGRASGPAPLQKLLTFTRDKVLSRQRKRLRSIDVHDIECMIGMIVQVGGVRRAAMISLSDLDDGLLQKAKHGEFWMHSDQRIMANNSAVYDERPTDKEFLSEWLSLVESNSGERGIFNRGQLRRQIPRRRKYKQFGVNPCGEILLRDKQFCNLSIAVIRPADDFETIKRKVRIATIFGTIQSAMTCNFPYLDPEWQKNCEEERLLGVDLPGAQENPLLRTTKVEGEALAEVHTRLKELQDYVREVNREWAARIGIAPSTAVTCAKPGGNSSVFLGVGHTITGWQSQYYIRNVSVNAVDPMAQFLMEQNVPHEPKQGQDPDNPSVWVFQFPVKAPDGAVLVNEPVIDRSGSVKLEAKTTALEQLESWLSYKRHWTEHNPSVTVNVAPDEWFAVGNWLLQHWEDVGGLSFLPRQDRVYKQAPMEECTEERYHEVVAKFPKIDWVKFFRYESEDMTTLAGDFACVGGACAIS
jgi:ribonucleoside-triphosphate reductase